ncbi:MAG: type II toxin-antitoxin system VapC family toxin [Nitrospinae bacterium]|nr:type II toxin-antitoxin system VapC family toxin [Nitrospinota bacterium]
MKFLLDTNICIFIIRKKPESVLKRLEEHAPGDIGISSVTLAELEYGVQKSLQVEQNGKALHTFLLPLEIAPFGREAAGEYGKIRAKLEAKGIPIGPLDLMIGAHALSLGRVVVSNNVREFSRIGGLRVQDWTKKSS